MATLNNPDPPNTTTHHHTPPPHTTLTLHTLQTGIGGVYRFDPTKRGGVWDGVTLTSSPWVTAFSDFQPSGGDKHWKHHE